MEIVDASHRADFEARAAANQWARATNLKRAYDFIVCGAGSSGSVVARRLAEDPSIEVLLIEAGGRDDLPSVMSPSAWPANLGSATDWGFVAEPNPHLNGRAIPMSMGKVLGGGSSINVMVWARGHRADWDRLASEVDDPSWSYSAVSETFRDIENWQGRPDPQHRGSGGSVFVQPSPDPGPIALATLSAAEEIGIPTFASQNGAMMEADGGCAITDVLIRNGKRHSIFRAYAYPFLDRPNLTVLTDTLVTRVLIEAGRAIGVETIREGKTVRFAAHHEVVLSSGAIQTPKLLMLSGIGDAAELCRLGIPVVEHLPGVGRNLQDHVSFGCIWKYKAPIAPRNTGSEATLYWKSDDALDAPDLLFCQVEFPVPSAETAVFGVPEHGWTMFAGLAHPKSRGQVRLRSSNPLDAPIVEANTLSHPDDLKTAAACVALCRELGNARAFDGLVDREAMPGPLTGEALDQFLRNAAVTYWHQTCSAKMGRDPMSVVDGKLRVHGVQGLRIADGSVFPHLPTGNTMAPCVIVGERAAAFLKESVGADRTKSAQ